MHSLKKLFRFVLGIQGAIVVGARINEELDRVEIEVRRHGNAKPRCQECRTKLTGMYLQEQSTWRHLDLFKKRAYLMANRIEGYCATCRGRRKEGVPWASCGAKHTREFDRQVARLVQVADRTAVSRMFDVAWRTVGRMVSRVVKSELPGDLMRGLRYISVDETSYKRGHRYITVITDLMTGRVVWIAKGKSAATLSSFFAELGKKRSANIELVVMDMSRAYISAVEEHAPNADIVFDKFHLVKLLMEAIDEIRREECRRLTGEDRKALKKTRFALLRNPKNYSPKDEAAIERIKQGNNRLFRTYQHRVDFEGLWECASESSAEKFIMKWTRGALLSRREPLRKFALTIRNHLDGILGYFRWGGVTNAGAEGMNNKIKLLIHKAFGFRSVEALMSMIYLCCSGIDLA